MLRLTIFCVCRYRLAKEQERHAEQVRALQDELQRQDDEIARKDAENRTLQNAIANQSNTINNQNDQIDKLSKDLDDKEDEVVKLKKDLRDKSKQYQVRAALSRNLHQNESQTLSLIMLTNNCLGSRCGLQQAVARPQRHGEQAQ